MMRSVGWLGLAWMILAASVLIALLVAVVHAGMRT